MSEEHNDCSNCGNHIGWDCKVKDGCGERHEHWQPIATPQPQSEKKCPYCGSWSCDGCVGSLKAELAEKEKTTEQFLLWRGVEKVCKKCNGTGRLAYGDTSTWHHMAGGSTITHDVCEFCWGSGDRNEIGVNLRLLTKELAEKDKEIERLKTSRVVIVDSI